MTRDTPAWIGISVLLAAAAYLAATHSLDGPQSLETDAAARLSSGLALLIVILGSTAYGYRSHVTPAVKLGLAWLAIGLGVAVLVTYRAELVNVAQSILNGRERTPMVAQVKAPGGAATRGAQAAISAGHGGHFFVEALVNGTHTRLVADTGATLVALTYEDALRTGIKADDLRFTNIAHTANGAVRLAHATLDEVRVGPITLRDVRASVSPPGLLSDNLLGMSFLAKLSSFHIRGDQLILRQ